MSVEAVSPFGAPAPEPEPGGPLTVSVQDFLNRLLELDGSDLHLTAGAPPTVRVHGDLMRLETTRAHVVRLNQIPPGPFEKLAPSPQTATDVPVFVTSIAP